MSHASCVVYAIIMAAFSTGLHYAGISMGYLYLLMGVIISGAVLPASLTLLSAHQSRLAATLSPPLALTCSLIGWLVTAKRESGHLSVATTGANNPMLVGNVVSLLAPLIFVPLLSFLPGLRDPKPYDWQSMQEIRKPDDSDLTSAAHVDPEALPGAQQTHDPSTAASEAAEESRLLTRASKRARYLTVFLALSFLVLWPMPMYGSRYIFSRQFFTGWIVVGILWLFCSAFVVGVYPVVEGRHTIVRTVRAVWRDVSGRGGGGVVVHGRATIAETAEVEVEKDVRKGGETPPEKAVEG